MAEQYDTVILGGGLAGLTLSLQLKKANPKISILVLEKRSEKASESTHKVGESTVELGTYYLRENLGLADYLDEHQLPKYGLRYFFSPHLNKEIHRRVEYGAKFAPPIPSHQIDRGIFENYLIDLLFEMGVEVCMGASVESTDLNPEGHTVQYLIDAETKMAKCKWLVDATGRRSMIKREQSLQQKMEHEINAAWFRIKGDIDVEDWTERENWEYLPEPGFRRLATTHLMGEGYWVWLIPLVSGNTSVGIVADDAFHDFDKINTLEKSLGWIREFEPQLSGILESRKDDVLDFLCLKHFSFGSKKLYSPDRWALTGEAGAFIDAFYSPGTDLIGINNTLISDLIIRDLKGQDVHVRTLIYERVHQETIQGFLELYQNKYGLFGHTQIMVFKITWDWVLYWGFSCLLFTNEAFTNIDVLRPIFFKESGIGVKYGKLNASLQKLFVDWGKLNQGEIGDKYFDLLECEFVFRFHRELVEKFQDDQLLKKLEENLSQLEQFAIESFRIISHHTNGTSMDILVDPYSMSLSDPSMETQDLTGIDRNPLVDEIIGKMWISN